jgi:hypothetical protein
MATFFNEYFGVTTDQVDDFGAFNVSIINDLPLFIDPFLLFNSAKPEYQQLHADILKYMMFLRDKIISGDHYDRKPYRKGLPRSEWGRPGHDQ